MEEDDHEEQFKGLRGTSAIRRWQSEMLYEGWDKE